MHIPFGWAKQRPQFLAEYLSKTFDIELATLESFRRKNLRNENPNLPHLPVFTIPFGHKSKKVRILNSVLVSSLLAKWLKEKKIIWLTHPKLWPMVKSSLETSQWVVYDCMDNAAEFPREKKNTNLQTELMVAEKELMERANLILFSAQNLQKTLLKRYSLPFESQKHYVVNNGIVNSIAELAKDTAESENFEISNHIWRITYVGTISEWFDFQLILKTLNQFVKLEVQLFGPAEVEIPVHPRLHYHGPIPHQQVFEELQKSDGLIMPFKITPLIESVNPVKLYEYIAAGKPIFAPSYQESLPFEPFVFLYKDESEWFGLINSLEAGQLKVKGLIKDRIDFCFQNTWEKKAEFITDLLQGQLLK